MLFIRAAPIGFCDGGDSREGGPEGRFHSGPGGDVWDVKTGRPSREAVVAGVLARAHALEGHLGSSGSVPCGWSTKGRL